jgi:cyclopropane fatty-acyl-phospholipid synthase-like methyltransferase
MSDYLEIEYAEQKRPLTAYPRQLANHLFETLSFKAGESLLEFGSGRAEILSCFTELGLNTSAVDGSESSATFAEKAGARFTLLTFKDSQSIDILHENEYDIIFSKSFVEHIGNPLEFSAACYKLLKPGGLFVTLTPDWESNKNIFYDDLTHIKPFTKVAMEQFLEYGNFNNIEVRTFRQLPKTWNSEIINVLASITSHIAKPRAKNKWMRWSRELMIIGVGRKPTE